MSFRRTVAVNGTKRIPEGKRPVDEQGFRSPVTKNRKVYLRDVVSDPSYDESCDLVALRQTERWKTITRPP